MTQEQLNLIVKIIRNGAPVLADELTGAICNYVVAYNKLQKAYDKLKKEKEVKCKTEND